MNVHFLQIKIFKKFELKKIINFCDQMIGDKTQLQMNLIFFFFTQFAFHFFWKKEKKLYKKWN